ncbi:MAG: hypothetical protein ACAI44_21625 [Candidatus Sericytochromatia bacterium]
MAAQDINTKQPLPEQTFYSSKPGVRLFVDAVNSGRAHTATTGKLLVGLIDPKDAKFALKPEFAPVSAGAIDVVLEQLVKSWNGTLSAAAQDLNPLGMEIGNGTSIKTVDVQPGSPVTSTTHGATACTKRVLNLVTSGGAAFAGKEGKVVLIAQTNSNAPPMRGIIQSISGDAITLFYELDEIPAVSKAVTLLDGFEQDLGGNQGLIREFIMAADFLNGASHHTVIWRGQPISGFDQGLSNDDKTKTMIEVQVLGYAKTSAGAGSTMQIVPATVYGTYGTAAVS